MSPGWRSSASWPVMWCATTASCTCTAPFGRPVVPLVKCNRAMSSAAVLTISKVSDATSIAAVRSIVPAGRVSGDIGQQHMLEAWQLLTPGFDLAAVERLRGDEDPGLADRHARPDRLRPERGEKGTEHAPIFQRAESGQVEFRDAAEQREHPVTPGDREVCEETGKPVGLPMQDRVGKIAHLIVTSDPPQGEPRQRDDPPPRGRY